MSTTPIKGYRIKDGKVTKIDGYGLERQRQDCEAEV